MRSVSQWVSESRAGATASNCPFAYMSNLSPNACLQASISRHDVAGIRYVTENMHVDYAARNQAGQNPIHFAISSDCDDDIIAALLEQSRGTRSAIHDVDGAGYTPLMQAVRMGKFGLAIRLISDYEASPGVPELATSSRPDSDPYQETLKHTSVLLESRGNIARAIMVALDQELESFIRLLDGHHLALRRACESSDIEAAGGAISAGADPSYELLSAIAEKDLTSALKRVVIIKNLLAVGADPSTALAYATLQQLPINVGMALMLLGASRESAAQAVSSVSGLSCDAEDLMPRPDDLPSRICQAAIAGDDEALEDCLSGGIGRVTTDSRVLIPLANGGHIEALRLLQEFGGIETCRSIERLLEHENTAAITNLIRSGVDVVASFRQMADRAQRGARMGIEKLSTFQALGASPSNLLLETVGHSESRYIAKVLLAAGARSDEALKRAPSIRRSFLTQALAFAAREVVLVVKNLRSIHRHDDATLVEDILLAQGARDRGHNTKLMAAPGVFRSANDAAAADLMEAVLNVDWALIHNRAGRDESVATEVLFSLLENGGSAALLRLLLRAGAPMLAVIRKVLHVYRDQEHIVFAYAQTLIAAGHDVHILLEQLVEMKGARFTEKIIKETDFELINLFKSLANTGQLASLKKLIPLQADFDPHDLTMVDPHVGPNFARKLMALGADATPAFARAVKNNDVTKAIELLEMGIDKSRALAKMPEIGRSEVGVALLVLGADLGEAIEYMKPAVRKQLVPMLSLS